MAADAYWPLADDMPLEGFSWSIVENGDYARMEKGAIRTAPVAMGTWVEYEGDYAMSEAQFSGLFIPWWTKRASLGGVSNGVTPFWLRDPTDQKPYRWIRQQDQKMTPTRDGVGWLVRLPLLRIPLGASL